MGVALQAIVEMSNKILRSSDAKYHYSYLFFYKINNGDLSLMYPCVFWCEFIDLVGVFCLLLFDESDRGFSPKRYWAITLPQAPKRYRYNSGGSHFRS